ncbi:hypothetical protein ACFQ1R_11665 [Mariniflexile jejuense]|uniref:Uncharacterized protein n=1 Tax=Mariniflexile jejuense TaxID=1173582 RepID=A0ABW3JJV0_9FLAO
MKYKYLIILIIFNFIQVSCTNEEDNCLAEKQEIIEKFNELIESANGDESKIKALIKQRDDKIRILGC